jgi:hypothetical protein
MMRRFLVFAAAMTLAACGSDAVGPSGSIVGDYDLQRVNGASLPVLVGNGVLLNSDVLTLNGDGTYSDVAQLSDGSVVPEQGFYDESNGFITFSPTTSGLSQYSGSVSGSILTTTFSDGSVEVYQRR